ncbi:hypothetical protein EYF80_023739 [Liparis tanakae]|uniref:Uncharacterized protein n=1 Tax=Liparis tanakae TaxID=230148 RepID=A0A4Z2HLW2_9TELE|nr:hypothetical protein EYF80_023739 [Liparis tanakae]
MYDRVSQLTHIAAILHLEVGVGLSDPMRRHRSHLLMDHRDLDREFLLPAAPLPCWDSAHC